MEEPTTQQAMKAKELVRKEQEDLMEELSQMVFANGGGSSQNTENSFVLLDEENQHTNVSSLINCEHKFIEAYIAALGDAYQKSRKRVVEQQKFMSNFYLLVTSEEPLIDSDGERLAKTSCYISAMYKNLVQLKNDVTTMFEAIRQIKSEGNSNVFQLHNSFGFQRIWRQAAEVMYMFVAVDHIANTFPNLGKQLAQYQLKLRQKINNEGTVEEKMKYTENGIAQEEAHKMIMQGGFFRAYYESNSGEIDKCPIFAREMALALQEMLENWEKSFKDSGKSDDRLFCRITAMTVFYYHHFYNFVDLSFIKKVVHAAKKVPFCRWIAEEIFVPLEFLRFEISSKKVFDGKLVTHCKKMVEDARNYGKGQELELVKEIKTYCQYAVTWTEEFKSKKREMDRGPKNLAQWGLDVSELFLKLIRILNHLVRNFFLLIRSIRSEEEFHVLKMDKTTQITICTTIETIKIVENVVLKHWRIVDEGAFLARQQWRKHLLRIMEDAKKSYVGSKNKIKVEEIAKLSLFHIAESQLVGEIKRGEKTKVCFQCGNARSLVNRGIMNPSKNLAFNLAYEFGRLDLHVSGSDKQQVQDLMSRLDTSTVHVVFWNELPILDLPLQVLRYVNSMNKNSSERSRIPEQEQLYVEYLLRNIKRLQLADYVISIADEMPELLQAMWYQLETLAPHNAKMYTQMFQLAEMKYGMKMLDTQLPQVGIDESVVLMDLLRNFPHFVANYCLSMQNQMFIEKSSVAKQLRLIRLEDLGKALRQHGIGIVPTAVNAAYQLIRHKMQTVFSFLAEDTVRHQVLKYLQKMEENETKKSAMYKVEWAESVVQALGQQNRTKGVLSTTPTPSEFGEMTDDGSTDQIHATHFDKFRQIITQIGNAISFIRLLCQAAEENEIDHLELFPSIKKHMEDLESSSGIPSDKSAYRLGLIKNMFERISNQGDFVGLMILEFKSLLLNNSLSQERIEVLDYFHGVLPALFLSQMNYSTAHENRIKKVFALNQHRNLVVCDDGLGAGCAFLLHVMDGWDAYDNLNWFESFVNEKEDELKLLKRSGTLSRADELRCERLRHEHEVFCRMNHNFSIQNAVFQRK
ncbi:Protein CBG20911 [Caenorhabditis briggsae]|uniref:Protein CBG20911 n=2 Tax=Caenorhabditis briggsae TaxID=6238 RepID=A8XYX7_CAEBR|nr:Protein CBG20911 [Caenorhabditis briggsae]CAP37844.2 Protein CBG20911 [Caenorhabditis briggsae]